MKTGTRYTTADFQDGSVVVKEEVKVVASDSMKTFSMLHFRLPHNPVMTSNHNI